jgi:hypothetical protein
MELSHIFCNVGYKGEQTIYVTVCVVVCVRWSWRAKVPTWLQLYAVTLTGELYSSKHVTFGTVKHFRELPTHLKRTCCVMKNTKVHEVDISDFEFEKIADVLRWIIPNLMFYVLHLIIMYYINSSMDINPLEPSGYYMYHQP